ncbi:hypothetical protein J4Q44_G00086850 [Coregonus suidteri]|uniref:EF-hand domain-containing protein n=1 Tax=Coregonus suidteri TaxID=861788 RepID=A0AAN8R1S2_9TELE
MFDEEGNGTVKTQELERLMNFMGINPTKRELLQMAKDVDKDGKGTFNRESFLGLMALVHESAKDQDAVQRAAFKVFDEEAKGYIEWNTLNFCLESVFWCAQCIPNASADLSPERDNQWLL